MNIFDIIANLLNLFKSSKNRDVMAREKFPIQGSGSDSGILKVVKESDQAQSSNETLTNDDELFLTVEPNKTYRFILFLSHKIASGGAQSIKFAFSIPSGTMVFNKGIWDWDAQAALIDVTTSNVQDQPSSTTQIIQEMHGILITGASGGTLNFKWAQFASNPVAISVMAGSSLELISN